MSLRRLRCPAYPMCTAEYVVHFPNGPGRNSWGTTVRHVIPSGSMMNQPCPASDIRVTWIGAIKPGDQARIDKAGADWVRRTAQALATRTDDRTDDEIERGLRELMQLGRAPDQPRDTYFPGRPADAPEPGVGERPAGPAPWDLGGGFLGRAAMENARDQLRTLLGLAIDQMASGQDTLARMTALVDSITALAAVVSENLRAAEGLVAAAVGSSTTDLPESARILQAQIAVAKEAVTTSQDGLTMALRVKIEQVFSQLSTGIEAAREYQALP